MTVSSIEQEIIAFLKTNIVGADVEILSNTAFSDVGIDSFSIVEIILFIERKYDYLIPDTDMQPEHFKNVQSIANLVGKAIL